MAKVPLLNSRTPGITVSAGATNYNFLANSGITSNLATEAGSQTTFRVAGTLSDLYVRIPANATTGSSTIRTRVNGGNGNQSVSIGAGTTGEFEDTSNSDSISAGDEVNHQLVNGGGGTLTYSILQASFAASSNTVIQYLNEQPTNSSTASTTFYTGIGGPTVANTSESHMAFNFKTAGTMKNLFVNVTTNGRSSSTTVVSRKNGADGNLTLSVTASTTGIFEDTSNSDTIAVDDDYNMAFTLGTGTGNYAARNGVEFETTDSSTQLIATVVGLGGIAVNTSVTTYYPYAGRLTNTTTEADTKAEVNSAMTISKFQIYLSANTVSATSTLKTRINGADGNQTASITASTTGWFEDTSNSDVLAATDELNYMLTTGASGTSLTPNHAGVKAVITVAVAATPARMLMGMGL